MIGTDLVDIRRIAKAITRSQGRFITRYFTLQEQLQQPTRGPQIYQSRTYESYTPLPYAQSSSNITEIDLKQLTNPYTPHFPAHYYPPHSPQLYLQAAYFAKRFAAKEAVLKALGRGLFSGIDLLDIEVIKTNIGKPEIRLYREAAKLLGARQIHISLADEFPYAQAFAIISAC